MQDFFKKIPKIPDLDLSELFERIPLPAFGQKLRDARTLHGQSIEELANAVNIPPSVLRDMESGKRPAPPEDTVKAMGAALNLSKSESDELVEAADLSTTIHNMKKDKTSALPSFTAAILVFLIADIRGYTRFTQEHGDTAAAKLTARFTDLAHNVADQYDGKVIEVRGDEVLAVFASAKQALLAAHMLQARCAEEHAAHPDLPLLVGMGLDVGEPTPTEEGGYRGLALNRAARLCSIAGPGDVLVSTGVAHIAPQVDGITFVQRGQQELKGIEGQTPILLAARTEVIDPSSEGIPPAEE